VTPPRSAQPDDSPALRHDRDLAACEDAALLARYRGTRDQEAFAQIAARYGPMVFRTCYRSLANVHDAEDATQAVFLLLARQPHKAQVSLAGWLHKAARDTAITLLRARARRLRREEAAAMRPAVQKSGTPESLREEIDHGIARLPTQLREAVIVCYLEGHRQEEAARRLGCSQGTLSRRAADAVERLRALLVRRGVAVTSAVLLGYLLQQKAAASVPEGLLGSLALAAGGKAAGLSASAGALADATARACLLAKAKVAAGVVVASGIVAAAATFLALRSDAPAVPARAAMVLASFDGPTLPLNKAGAGYPAADDDDSRFTTSIEPLDAVAGKSLRIHLTAGRLKVPFMPEDAKGRKLFARELAADPAAWRFNTYNRFRFWLKLPVEAPPHSITGSTNMNVGTYVKRIKDADERALDTGGGAFSHRINVPALACWTQIVLNMHPHSGEKDAGYLPHPTGEPTYNYFDALTRFFIEARLPPERYPADYLLDEMEFYQETRAENDEQVYGIAATHSAAQNRLIVTWSRRQAEDSVVHEVRYAFADIHTTGWKNANPAPRGFVAPPGQGIANGMVYDSQGLPLAGERLVYIAIKPQNSELFAQIAVPLTLK
jgi:RNA polymerase sigma factor (sigma-70 family)